MAANKYLCSENETGSIFSHQGENKTSPFFINEQTIVFLMQSISILDLFHVNEGLFNESYEFPFKT